MRDYFVKGMIKKLFFSLLLASFKAASHLLLYYVILFDEKLLSDIRKPILPMWLVSGTTYHCQQFYTLLTNVK
jgi:hypothetical protein